MIVQPCESLDDNIRESMPSLADAESPSVMDVGEPQHDNRISADDKTNSENV